VPQLARDRIRTSLIFPRTTLARSLERTGGAFDSVQEIVEFCQIYKSWFKKQRMIRERKGNLATMLQEHFEAIEG